MSVVRGIEGTDEDHDGWQLAEVREGRECAFCGSRVLLPAIYWMGNPEMWFHPVCALHLSVGLLQDYRSVVDGEQCAWPNEQKKRDRNKSLAAAMDRAQDAGCRTTDHGEPYDPRATR